MAFAPCRFIQSAALRACAAPPLLDLMLTFGSSSCPRLTSALPGAPSCPPKSSVASQVKLAEALKLQLWRVQDASPVTRKSPSMKLAPFSSLIFWNFSSVHRFRQCSTSSSRSSKQGISCTAFCTVLGASLQPISGAPSPSSDGAGDASGDVSGDCPGRFQDRTSCLRFFENFAEAPWPAQLAGSLMRIGSDLSGRTSLTSFDDTRKSTASRESTLGRSTVRRVWPSLVSKFCGTKEGDTILRSRPERI
mmetsp:Transcript_36675/g.66486  ORF Transcript_36675/g.66486 Transcript_36675/m.66486 type:complete len:249 (+) Transcript_36675:521-1267(+)